MKRVRRLLAATASLALTVTLLTLGGSPIATASINGKGTGPAGAMPMTPDNPAGTEWLNDCLGSTEAHEPDGRIYNRFKWCQKYEIVGKYYKIENDRRVLKGINTIRGQAAAIGYNNARATRVFFRAETGSVDYDVWSILEKRLTAPKLKLEIDAQCVPGTDQPASATCGVGRSPAKMEWAQWSNFSNWVYWDVSSVGGEGDDKVAFHKWRIAADGASPGYEVTIERGQGPPIGIRCDSADYFNDKDGSYPHACVYTAVLPFLTYDSAHPDIRQHIRDAQNAPATDGVTYPKENHPKKIPGKWSATAASRGAPLHRVVSRKQGGAIAAANEGTRLSACGRTGGLNPWSPNYDATTGLPPYNTDVDDCDEYPFSSTFEGASSVDWDFSVRNINYSENRSAGTKLNNFYVNDRILAWPEDDPFWVNVN
ncbi:NucA/NucB deoxyribonuclease domain-containing protein [Actinocorallia longicatena]|uniref:Deoxyribonuclease NucA/NucB domain-containing protein n=1 Tax=Actinocorallia longicatena TaxID=111803 RepID=A0ABP6QBL0_9ACTN